MLSIIKNITEISLEHSIEVNEMSKRNPMFVVNKPLIVKNFFIMMVIIYDSRIRPGPGQNSGTLQT